MTFVIFKFLLKMKLLLCLVASVSCLSQLVLAEETNITENEVLDISNKVFGGLTVPRADYRYVARLKVNFRFPQTITCTGIVLTDRIILTAAQCLRREGGDNARSIHVTLPTGGFYFFTDRDVIVHPEYRNEFNENNVAILRKDTFLLTFMRGFTIPPRIATEAEITAADTTAARVIGWGRTSSTRFPNPFRPNYGEVVVDTLCNDYTGTATLTNAICTRGDSVAGLCDGDWGAPLIANNRILGIGVFRSGDCVNSQNSPSIYFKLSAATEFLNRFPELVNFVQ